MWWASFYALRGPSCGPDSPCGSPFNSFWNGKRIQSGVMGARYYRKTLSFWAMAPQIWSAAVDPNSFPFPHKSTILKGYIFDSLSRVGSNPHPSRQYSMGPNNYPRNSGCKKKAQFQLFVTASKWINAYHQSSDRHSDYRINLTFGSGLEAWSLLTKIEGTFCIWPFTAGSFQAAKFFCWGVFPN